MPKRLTFAKKAAIWAEVQMHYYYSTENIAKRHRVTLETVDSATKDVKRMVSVVDGANEEGN